MSIPGFSASDLALVQATLRERFGHDVQVQEEQIGRQRALETCQA